MFNSQDVVKISEFEVTHRDLYSAGADRSTATDGVLDKRLVGSLAQTASNHLRRFFQVKGISNSQSICDTCGQTAETCVGHYAYIKLVLPVFHIGYFKHILAILQAVCKVRCSNIPATLS